jgi:hypothetical protein
VKYEREVEETGEDAEGPVAIGESYAYEAVGSERQNWEALE